jgi:hypothetical protein
MSNAQLVYPMFALVVLTAFVLGITFRRRVAAVKAEQVPAKYFRVYQGAIEPEAALQASRHFTNLFEAPTLFYVACVAAIATGHVSLTMTVLAWVYVLARLVHAWIHLGANRVKLRIRAYFASWLALGSMWLVLLAKVASDGN